jgi:hypothetical protein
VNFQRAATYGLAAVSAAIPATAMAETVTFPGSATSVQSPVGRAKVVFLDPGENADGLHLFKLKLDDGRGHVVLLRTFTRSADVSWSPSGDRLFITDYVGSNVADCLAIKVASQGAKGVRLLGLIARNSRRPPSSELRGHFYVHCDGWLSNTKILVSIDGHTDETPSHGFSYALTFDTVTHRIAWTKR